MVGGGGAEEGAAARGAREALGEGAGEGCTCDSRLLPLRAGVGHDELVRFTRMTCDLIENMRRLEKPIVAALNGTTCGAGAVHACCRARQVWAG